MGVNYASKYAQQIDERFKLGMLTGKAVNNDYDFTGVKTVNVYSLPTAQMNDYTRSGANRYGNPAELENSVQELTLRKDRSFTFTIDRGNYTDTQMVAEAGKALQRQIDEVVIPEVDIYRIAEIANSAKNAASAVVTSSNAYDVFLDGISALTDEKAPLTGRIAYVSPKFYKLIKLDSAFIKASDMAQDMLIKGQIGMIDGVAIIVVPTSYLPTNAAFVITSAIATTAPIKLADYYVHENPPGIDGWLVEGRVYYDAFVLNNKKGAIYVHIDGEPVAPTLDPDTLNISVGEETKDSEVEITWNNPTETFANLMNGSAAVNPTNFEYADGVLTIKKEYLNTLAEGTKTFKVKGTEGGVADLSVVVA